MNYGGSSPFVLWIDRLKGVPKFTSDLSGHLVALLYRRRRNETLENPSFAAIPFDFVLALAVFPGLATEASFVGVIVGVAFLIYELFWMLIYTCILGVASGRKQYVTT